MTFSHIIVLLIVGIGAYVFASTLTGFSMRDMAVDGMEELLNKSIRTASKMSKRNKQEFDLMSEQKKLKSVKYRYYMFVNELLLDLGWRKKGITAESFTVLNFVAAVFCCAVLSLLVHSLFILAYMLVIFFILNIAIMFSVSRYGARQRTRKLIAAENLICGNISKGFEDAVRMNIDLFDSSVRPAFANFLDRYTLQSYTLSRALTMLNLELGSHSTPLCSRVYIFEQDRRPGMEDMFRFIMQCNIREEERAAIRDVHFNEMNLNFFICSGILVVFLFSCIASMPEVLSVYLTDGGKMILAVFFSLIALAFVFIQALQSKPFKYMPEKTVGDLMYFFFIGLALTFSIFLCIRIYSWKRMPRKSGSLAKAMYTKERLAKESKEARRKKQRVTGLMADICRDLKIFPYGREYELEVNKMIAALDLRVDGDPMLVDHLYVKQCFFGVGTIGVALLMVIAMSIAFGGFMPIGFATVVAAPIFFKIPLWQMRSDFKDEQLTAMSQWLEFYNMYYSQFVQKENNVLLIDVVDNFLPLANPELAKLLKRFRTDLDTSGDDIALDKLKYRYQDNLRIHKFVSIAKMRMTGDQSAFDLMRSVQDDLLAEEELAYNKDLKRKSRLAANVVDAVLYVSLAMLFSVMIYAMIA